MQASPIIRARLSAPLSLATVIVAAGLLAIIWTVKWATADSRQRIDQVTAAGAARVRLPDTSHNLSNALPTFQVDIAPGTAQPVAPSLPTQWDNQTWLAAAIDDSGGRWVWAGTWFDCARVDAQSMTYDAGANWPTETWDQKIWRALVIQQDVVIEVCNGQ